VIDGFVRLGATAVQRTNAGSGHGHCRLLGIRVIVVLREMSNGYGALEDQMAIGVLGVWVVKPEMESISSIRGLVAKLC
jgi:hypothetical protein